MEKFKKLGLGKEIVDAISELNFENPTGYTTTLTITTIPIGPADISTLYETIINFDNVAYYTAQVCWGIIDPIYPVSEIFYFLEIY